MDRYGSAFRKNNNTKNHMVTIAKFFASLKQLLLLIFLSLYPALALSNQSDSSRRLIDEMIAIVNDEPVLNSTVSDKVTRGPLVLVSSYPATEASSAFEKALQDTINICLVMKRAKELEIEVSEDQMNEQIKGLASSNHITINQLKEYIEQNGRSFTEYKNDLKQQMIFMRFKGRELVPKIKVTDKDVEAYYLKNFGSMKENTQIHIRHILISLPASPSEDLIRAKEKMVDQIYKKLGDGMNFMEAARIYSDQKGAREQSSSLKMKLKDLPEELAKEVGAIEAGSFTAPIKTTSGYQIIYLEKKEFAPSEAYLAKKDELEMRIREERLAQLTRSWIETARQKAKIKLLTTNGQNSQMLNN